jgi:BCD family chlorophyll transporter-like MFS transporter
VIQGAALVTMVVNILALWKQEPRNPSLTAPHLPRPSFHESWQALKAERRWSRVLVAVGLGTAGFSMQDILLEPYGGEILKLSVGETTALTALIATGTITGFAVAAHRLAAAADPYRLAAYGILVGLVAFSAVIFSAPLGSPTLFRVGTALIGFGGGLFAVGTLTAAMALGREGQGGLALGAWGAVQASAAGLAIAAGGILRDVTSSLAVSGALGPALTDPSTGYGIVYHVELAMMFATLVALGPLVRPFGAAEREPAKFGLAELPG